MSDPIKIVVVAQTEQAAADLQNFVKAAGNDLSANLKKASKASEEVTKGLMGNRMAMMELGHVGRATAESLAFGISPLKVLALESPRIIQASTMMGLSLSAMLPWVLGIGAAVGAGALAWTAYMNGVEDTTQKTKDLITELNKIPATLEKIQTLQKAGLMSPAAANEAADILSGKKKMYVGPDGKPTFDATSKVTEQNVTQGGMVAFSTAGREVQRQNELIPVGDPRLRQQAESLQPNVADEQVKGKLKVMALDKEANEAVMSHIEKEIAAVHDQFEKKRQEMYLAAQQAGGLIGPHQLNAAQQGDIAKFDQAEANEIAKIKETAALAQAQKQNQEVVRAEVDKNRMVLEQDQQLNTAIENYAAQTTDKTKAYWDEVYRAKFANAKDELDRELITQEQFDKKVADATKENIAGYKAVNAELARRAQMEQEIARGKIQAQLAGVQSNPLLTDQQKIDQSIPLQKELLLLNDIRIAKLQSDAAATADTSARLQAEEQINGLLTEQVDLKNRISAEENPWATMFTQLQSQGEITMASLAATFSSVFNSAISSVSNGLTSVIMGTMRWSQFLMQIPRQILGEIVGSIIHIGVQWFATHVLMEGISRMFHAKDVGMHLAAETTKTIATVTGATKEIGAHAAVAGAGAASSQASIPYVGPILAVIAMGAIFAAVMAMASKFAQGGLVTGPGSGTSDSIPASLSNGEYVIRANAVSRIGLDTLDHINAHGEIKHRDDFENVSATSGRPSGRAAAGASDAAGGTKTDVLFFMDRSSLLDHMKSSEATNIIVAAVAANKMRLGIQT